MSSWMKVSAAAASMGMSYSGALRRLKRMDRKLGGRLLRNLNEWEVCVAVLDELKNPDAYNVRLEGLDSRMSDMDGKITALRNSHQAHRRITKKRLEKHYEAIKKIGEAMRAIGALSLTDHDLG